MMETGPNGAGTWNKSNKSTGSSTAYDRSTFEKRNSTFELHNMTDKMSSQFPITLWIDRFLLLNYVLLLLDYSEDHHDDIYPYATFELLRDRPRSPVKILDQPPVHLFFAIKCSKSSIFDFVSAGFHNSIKVHQQQ